MISLIKIKYQRMLPIQFELSLQTINHFLESAVFDLKNREVLNIDTDKSMHVLLLQTRTY
jgi:hypothetical protein